MVGRIEGTRSRVAGGRASRGLDGWTAYLLLVVALAPILVPGGPAQLAIVDLFNFLALGCFAVGILTRRIRVHVPFVGPVLVISIGSLIAMVNAESVPAAGLAMVQDTYLYLWFIMLVSLMSARGDLPGLRIAWVWVANGVALIGLAGVFLNGHASLARMLGPRGVRATGTFLDPNMFADYLTMGLFMVLSLGRRLNRLVRWGSIALLLLAIVAAKSNGGALSLVVGLAVWAVVSAGTRRLPVQAIAAIALVIVSLGLTAWWMTAGFGVGATELKSLQSHSFLARVQHSSEGRFKIWKQLERTYSESPLGIGPGNSRWVTLSVEQRERPNSMYSKEAHSDYLAYAIERGPLAALALIVLLGQAFAKLGRGWQRRRKLGTADATAATLAAALAGALTSSVVHSLTLERLHFRHFWLLLAMVCAFEGATRAFRTETRPARPKAVEVPGRSMVAAGV